MDRLSAIFAKLMEHPVWTTGVGMATGLASFWYLFSGDPPIPAIYAAVASAMSMSVLALVLLTALLLLSLALIGIGVYGGIRYKREATRLGAEVVRLQLLSAQVTQLIAERDAALNDLERAKSDFGRAKLKWYSSMTFGDTQPTVTVRSAAYGNDYALVQRIERIVREELQWAVSLDGRNDPMLPQAEDFKVIFEYANTLSFEPIAAAFSVGNLLGVPVGYNQSMREDYHHLIIKVLPGGRF